MTFEAGIDCDRHTLAGMAVCATFSKRSVQNIPHQCTTVTTVRVMTRAAIVNLLREIDMFLLHTATGMTV